MTAVRDRWQLYLKTRGQHYREGARELRELHARRGDVGGAVAALAQDALAETLERCRVARLTRHQHVLFRLGSLIATAEAAGALARRAARSAEGSLDPRTDRRFATPALCAVSRVFAREAAAEVAAGGLRLVVGAGGEPAADVTALAAALGTPSVQAAQEGLLADMDRVADALYDR